MTAKDYAPTLETAKRLVERFGRKVTLAKLSAATVSVGEPWRGPASPPALGTTGNQEVPAVFVGLLKHLGEDFLKDLEQVALIASSDDLSAYHLLVDGTVRWNIVRIQTLRPGATSIVHYVGVKR